MPSQCDELEEILLKFPKLFSGGLGKFNGEKIHLDLDPTVLSVASHAYAVPESTNASSNKNLITSFKKVF
jgi:hypothetical protein